MFGPRYDAASGSWSSCKYPTVANRLPEAEVANRLVTNPFEHAAGDITHEALEDRATRVCARQSTVGRRGFYAAGTVSSLRLRAGG